jgi:hypothetical protein
MLINYDGSKLFKSQSESVSKSSYSSIDSIKINFCTLESIASKIIAFFLEKHSSLIKFKCGENISLIKQFHRVTITSAKKISLRISYTPSRKQKHIMLLDADKLLWKHFESFEKLLQSSHTNKSLFWRMRMIWIGGEEEGKKRW